MLEAETVSVIDILHVGDALNYTIPCSTLSETGVPGVLLTGILETGVPGVLLTGILETGVPGVLLTGILETGVPGVLLIGILETGSGVTSHRDKIRVPGMRDLGDRNT